MTLIDRYLSFLFIKTFLVCFLSFTGLFVVIHLFSNLDEMLTIRKNDGVAGLALGFYGPRMAEMYDKMSAVMSLLAAIFAISLMQRRREFTALEAAGISRSRIVRPLLIFSLVAIAIGIANRELLLPSVRDHLVRTAQNWNNQDQLTIGTYHDLDSGIKIRGTEYSMNLKRIINPNLQLPTLVDPSQGQSVSHIEAQVAMQVAATANRESGLWLYRVTYPPKPFELKTMRNDQFTVYWPGDTPWLQRDECFVVCHYDGYQASFGNSLTQYESAFELIQRLQQPRTWYGRSSQIRIHTRLLQPLLDLSLLLLGIPLILRRSERNVFFSIGLCFSLILIYYLIIIGSHTLGEYSLLQPATAAWLPVLIFFPLAFVIFRGINH